MKQVKVLESLNFRGFVIVGFVVTPVVIEQISRKLLNAVVTLEDSGG
jgi:hypothetical protein